MTKPTTVLQVTKNVRLPAELLQRVGTEVARSGRTRNAEIIALLEEAIIQMRYSAGYLLTDHAQQSDAIADTLSGGESFQLRLPANLVDVIMRDVPELIGKDKDKYFVSDTFSEKIRYLLLRGLSERGIVIPIELGSMDGYVYQDKYIDDKISKAKKGISKHLDNLIDGASYFSHILLNSSGHVLLSGKPGSGKSLYAGYYRQANPYGCHYLNLSDEKYRSEIKKRTIILWPNLSTYSQKLTLIIDEANNLDEDYLTIFLRNAEKKNVRVILITQSNKAFEPSVLDLVSVKFTTPPIKVT
ncbi:Arc family DNA-binding protein [Cronobacter dublinensis subsp. dublinensis]|nr:Arc family DNA-binding protein [Cronobacter dublinensis subsp. dublinensis]EGT5729858.1 Arc family DNA-binding protein [Cronobacter dublinensis subsp. dublinensis]